MLVSFLSFIEPIFAWKVPLVSVIFLTRSLVFPILLFSSLCIVDLGWLSSLSLLFFGTLHSEVCTFPFVFCVSLLFFSQLFVRPSQTATCLLNFFFLGMVFIIACCTVLWTSICSSSGTLSDLIPWIYLIFLLYNPKGFVTFKPVVLRL